MFGLPKNISALQAPQYSGRRGALSGRPPAARPTQSPASPAALSSRLLVVLHVGREGGRCIVAAVAHGALEGFLIVVSLHMDFEVVAATKSRRN